MLAHAQSYAKLGWHVLPLVPGAKQPLSRLVPNGFHNATRDAATIEKWWTAEPTAGIGVALKASGLVAVDVDLRNDGFATLDDLQARHGKLESDVHQITGDGGWHIVYAAQLVEALPGKLGRGIDLKADGYICVEPSIHPNGKTYEWEASSSPLEGCIPSTLPSWIRDMARAPLQVPDAIVPTTAPTARWLDCLAALPSINADDRDTWLQVGMAIHNERPDAEGYRAWAEWSATSAKFDAKDQSRVWLSFKRRGLSGTTLNTVFAMAQRAGWKNMGQVPQNAPPEPVSAQNLLLTIDELDAASQRVRWSIKHILPADSVGLIFGAPGTFKSFIALDMALHIAHGLPWLGKKTTKGAVIYLAAEGGTGLMKRIRAWHMARGLSWKEIDFRVVTVPVMLSSKAETVVEAAKSVGIQPTLIVVDTKSQTDEGEENSSTDTAHYFRQLGLWFRSLWACAVVVIHHSGHSATERPRGSSAILGNVDFMFGVFRDEKEMLATMECARQKDGDLFEPVNFSMSVQPVAKDEDGETISSLVATHINSAKQLLESVAKEGNAGRVGHNGLIMRLAYNGIPEKELRFAFYENLNGKEPDAKRQAWYRALRWAVENRLLEVSQGVVMVLAQPDQAQEGNQ